MKDACFASFLVGFRPERSEQQTHGALVASV